MFGEDYLDYYYDKAQGLMIAEESIPTYRYDHSLWEVEYDEQLQITSQRYSDISQNQDGPIKKKARKSLFDTTQTNKPMSSNNNSRPKKRTKQDSTSTPKHNPSVLPSPKENSCTPQSEKSNQKKVHCPVNPSCSTHDLRLCKTTSGATRQQLANIVLPSIQPLCDKDITMINQPILGESDPYNLVVRPSKTALNWCDKMTSNLRKANIMGNITGVKFGNIGMLKLNDISVLHKFCELDDLRRDVLFESQWLNLDDGLPDKDVDELASALWDNEPSKVVLKVSLGPSTRAIDVTSLSCLCGERYLDNMVIDVCLTKYMWDSNEHAFIRTLVFPSSVWVWEKAQDDYFKEQLKISIDHSKSTITSIQQIIIPLYMPSHWGIVYISLQEGRIFFDDGMKYSVPNGLLTALKHILEVLHDLYPDCTSFNSGWWRQLKSFNRLGMPSQLAKDAIENRQGSGSCGVGVILTARDLMQNGNKGTFTWTFAESRQLRKTLMLQILKWAQ